jgi:DNA-binding CsgD family transcriptional regulator
MDDLRSGMNLISTILGISESTVKKHLLEIFEKLGVETRSAATLRALEVPSSPAPIGTV